MVWPLIVLAVASTAMKMKGAKEEHRAQQAQMARRKAELERNARLTVAVAQQQGFEQERQSRYVVSRARALAAFSGAGADDKTIMDVISDIHGEGEYRRNVAIYKGQEEARSLISQAEGTAEAMDAERKAYRYKQLGSLFDLGKSMYGGGGMGGGGGKVGSGSGYDYQADQSDSQWSNWGGS